MCSPPPPLLPRTDNLKFWLVGHHDLNPPHHHDNRSSQPPTSVWNLKCFFWMSVSAPSKYPSPAQAVKEEQISYYISFFLVSHQLKASMSWKKLNQMWWRMLFPCLVTLNVFFFSICNILSEECFEVLTPCLFSNITPVALNVYPENLTNKWLQPQFPLSTVPHCKM